MNKVRLSLYEVGIREDQCIRDWIIFLTDLYNEYVQDSTISSIKDRLLYELREPTLVEILTIIKVIRIKYIANGLDTTFTDPLIFYDTSFPNSMIYILNRVNSDIIAGTVNNTLLQGLVAHYTLNESTGNPVNSLGGSGSSPTNITYNASGKIGTSYSFNGTNSYVLLGNLTPTTTFSFSVWVNPTGIGVRGITGSAKFPEIGTGGGSYLRIESDNSIGLYKEGTAAILISSVNAAPNGSYTHIVATYNSSTGNAKIYANSVLVGSTTSVQTINTGMYWIGTPNGVSEVYNGLVDELALWNRELIIPEITKLYNSGAGNTYPFTS